MHCLDIECAVMAHFKPYSNIIVPNVSWGLFNHECDLIVATKGGCVYEIEIKTSRQDLIKDKQKRHGHNDSRIAFLYFAIPTKLMPFIEHIPEHAGIIEIAEGGYVEVRRKPMSKSTYRLNEQEMFKLARLGAMRILALKTTVKGLLSDLDTLRKANKQCPAG
jgi:hypothetical protein